MGASVRGTPLRDSRPARRSRDRHRRDGCRGGSRRAESTCLRPAQSSSPIRRPWPGRSAPTWPTRSGWPRRQRGHRGASGSVAARLRWPRRRQHVRVVAPRPRGAPRS